MQEEVGLHIQLMEEQRQRDVERIRQRMHKAQQNVTNRLKMYGYDQMSIEEKTRRYYVLEKYAREGLHTENFASLDEMDDRRHEIYIELSFYTPLVKVHWLDLLPYLPVPIVIHYPESAYEPYRSTHATYATVTKAVLHKRKDWCGGSECVAFHLEEDEETQLPYKRIPNTLAALADRSSMVVVSRVDAERMGITNDYYDRDILLDDRPAVRNSVQPIIYKGA